MTKSKKQADVTEAKDELIERAIAEGKALIGDGKTKIDAAMTMFRLIDDKPQAAVVRAFIEGASLTEKGALTYWYNCRRKLAKERRANQS